MLLQVDSDNSDQTGWMPRLIRVFAGHIGHFFGFVMWQFKCTSKNHGKASVISEPIPMRLGLAGA